MIADMIALSRPIRAGGLLNWISCGSKLESKSNCNSIVLSTYRSKGVSGLYQQQKEKPYDKREGPRECASVNSIVPLRGSQEMMPTIKIYFGPRKQRCVHQNSMICFPCSTHSNCSRLSCMSCVIAQSPSFISCFKPLLAHHSLNSA
jgi:hypothetical protein